MYHVGKLKNYLPEYVLNGEVSFEKYLAQEEIKDMIRKGCVEDKSDLKEFLQLVTPTIGPDYFAYVKDANGVTHNLRYNRFDYIDALCCLSQYEQTVFIHPASFQTWIKDQNVRSIRALYVDIDEVGMYADKTDKDTAIKFLKETYSLNDDQLGDFLILSGRGIHLVYLIDEMPIYKKIKPSKSKKKKDTHKPCPHLNICKNKELCKNSDECINRKTFKEYTYSLMSTLNSDFSGESPSHMYRCPTSYNLKEYPIKGKIFKLTDCTDRDIHRLDWCLKTEEEILESRSKYFSQRNEKRKATREKNKQKEEKFLNSLGDITLAEFISKAEATDEEIAFAKMLLKKKEKPKKNKLRNASFDEIEKSEEYNIFDNVYSESNALPYKHLKPFTSFKSCNRNWNLLGDLHNFFIRSHGELISRNQFFFIIAAYFKRMGEKDYYAVKYCSKYVDDDYYDEMEKIVMATYKNDNEFIFSYEYIALSLGFSETDIAVSYCNFSPERKKAAKSESNKRHYQKIKEKAGITPAKKKREEILKYIESHPEMNWQEAKDKLGIGRSTFFTMKNEIKTDG